MAVEITREGWITLFTQMRRPNAFLSRHFTMKNGGAYQGDKVVIDIERYDEDVAVVIKKSTGPNLNDFDEFTTKEFEPPAYGEAFPCNVNDLLKRMAGVDPYSAAYAGYAAGLMSKVAKGFILIDDKIRRAVELQAAQVLQTGQLDLPDENGNTAYALDFKPKATHFPTVANSWGGAGETPLDDLSSLAQTIRADGKITPNRLIMGETALRNFLNNAEVQAQLDNRRIEVGEFAPRFVDSGATFYNFIWVGNYRFEIWTYPDTYVDVATGNPVTYVAQDKVIMLAEGVGADAGTRLDLVSAEVPLPLGPDPRVAGLMPSRMTSREAGFDVTPNLYATNSGKQIMGELESRPLCIPVQIDGFGCLDTQV